MSASANNVSILSARLTPRGYEQIDLSDGLVHTLTPPTIADIVPIVAFIQASGGNANFIDSGPNPTAVFGMPIVENITINYFVSDLSAFKAIQQGANTMLNVLYYSFATDEEA